MDRVARRVRAQDRLRRRHLERLAVEVERDRDLERDHAGPGRRVGEQEPRDPVDPRGDRHVRHQLVEAIDRRLLERDDDQVAPRRVLQQGVGGIGADALAGGDGDDLLSGEIGNDRLAGGEGADRLAGGFEDDVLAGDGGADGLLGEQGWDTAHYGDRSAPLAIDLDDKPDDGAAGERDNVHTDVEVVVGGAANDRLTGNASPNYLYGERGRDRIDGRGASDRLFGGAGPDTLTGRGGADWLDGGAGADRLLARDGSREAVRCGGARDHATADRTDMLFGCERRPKRAWNWR